ncbi:MAG: hypothetical protein HZA79_15560 [Sphingobacteriales bacterium]|nr:hypothetical protein [Sphingobacteriales bacterium]
MIQPFYRLTTLVAQVLILSLLLVACAETQEVQPAGEKLLGFVFDYDKSEVAITVVTKGCTGKADFSIRVSGNSIEVQRKKVDACKAMPETVVFTYTMGELGVDPNKAYTVRNPFIANPNLAAIP